MSWGEGGSKQRSSPHAGLAGPGPLAPALPDVRVQKRLWFLHKVLVSPLYACVLLRLAGPGTVPRAVPRSPPLPQRDPAVAQRRGAGARTRRTAQPSRLGSSKLRTKPACWGRIPPPGPALPRSRPDQRAQLPAQPVLGHQKSHRRRRLVPCQQTQPLGPQAAAGRYHQRCGALSWKGRHRGERGAGT